MVSGLDKETSNDDIARHISFHELEYLLMCDPYSINFLKVL